MGMSSLRFPLRLPLHLASRNAGCSRRLLLCEDPPLRGPVRASTELTRNITIDCTVGHAGGILDHEVCRRHLLEIGRGQVSRMHGTDEPARRVVRVPAIQHSLAGHLVLLQLGGEKRALINDLVAHGCNCVADGARNAAGCVVLLIRRVDLTALVLIRAALVCARYSSISGSASIWTVLTSFRTNSTPMFESTIAYRSAPYNDACASYETPVAEYTSPAVTNDSMVNVCVCSVHWQACVWTVHSPQSSPVHVHVATWCDGMGVHHTGQRVCRHVCVPVDVTKMLAWPAGLAYAARRARAAGSAAHCESDKFKELSLAEGRFLSLLLGTTLAGWPL